VSTCPPRHRIACVVASGAGAGRAVRRATELAGEGATLDLLSVSVTPPGARPRVEPEQIDALAEAAVTAALQGVRGNPLLVAGPTEAEALLDSCPSCDLLVIAPGATADELARRTGVPMLVAS